MGKQVGVLVGSLRKESWNRKLATALIQLAPSSLNLQLVEIGQLPIYNQDPDDEGSPFPEWVAFRQKIKPLDALLFITPEYNRSIPGVLKNAVDVGSRPYGSSIWTGKPGAVISTSPGAIGGFGANQHLRQTFVFLDIPCMQQPEAYISEIHTLFDAKGDIIKENSREFLSNYLVHFAKWIQKFC